MLSQREKRVRRLVQLILGRLVVRLKACGACGGDLEGVLRV